MIPKSGPVSEKWGLISNLNFWRVPVRNEKSIIRRRGCPAHKCFSAVKLRSLSSFIIWFDGLRNRSGSKTSGFGQTLGSKLALW